MNFAELQKKLVAAARADAPSDGVPYAFEKRVMALLVSCGTPQYLDLWVRGLWKAAASCVTITLLCGAWSLFTPTVSTGSTDLSQDFENTLLASIDQGDQAP